MIRRKPQRLQPWRPKRHRLRGASLLEALVAAGLLAFALLAALRWQALARAETGLARERSEATQLAREALEWQRTFVALEPVADLPDAPVFSREEEAAHTVDGRTATFTVRRRTSLLAGVRLKAASVAVEWEDAAGQRQRVALDTLVDGSLPVHGAAATWAAAEPGVGSPIGQPEPVPLAGR